MTLYGLPMLEITTPGQLAAATTSLRPQPVAAPVATANDDYITVPYRDLIDSAQFQRQSTSAGLYDEYAGSVLAQAGLPVQPVRWLAVDTQREGRQPRSLILRSAAYHDEQPFNPLIAQAYVVSADPALTLPEPALAAAPAWDRDLPYALGHFASVTNTLLAPGGRIDAVSLNLVLGAYHQDEQRYRRY